MTDLEADLKIAQARIKELEAKVPKWISVEERLPEQPGKYLICTKDNPLWGRLIDNVWYSPCYAGCEDHLQNRRVWYSYDSEYGDYEIRDVTHWMPLPEAPKEG